MESDRTARAARSARAAWSPRTSRGARTSWAEGARRTARAGGATGAAGPRGLPGPSAKTVNGVVDAAGVVLAARASPRVGLPTVTIECLPGGQVERILRPGCDAGRVVRNVTGRSCRKRDRSETGPITALIALGSPARSFHRWTGTSIVHSDPPHCRRRLAAFEPRLEQRKTWQVAFPILAHMSERVTSAELRFVIGSKGPGRVAAPWAFGSPPGPRSGRRVVVSRRPTSCGWSRARRGGRVGAARRLALAEVA